MKNRSGAENDIIVEGGAKIGMLVEQNPVLDTWFTAGMLNWKEVDFVEIFEDLGQGMASGSSLAWWWSVQPWWLWKDESAKQEREGREWKREEIRDWREKKKEEKKKDKIFGNKI